MKKQCECMYPSVQEINLNFYLSKLRALSTECVLIDLVVTISIAVDTRYNFSHGEVGTKFHPIKTYN